MKTANQLQRQLKRSIMRRVYYAYGLMIAFHPLAIRGYLLAVGALLLAKLVHVAAVYHSFTSVKIGELGQYTLTTLYNADWATLGALFFVCMVVLSFRMPVLPIRRKWAV